MSPPSFPVETIEFVPIISIVDESSQDTDSFEAPSLGAPESCHLSQSVEHHTCHHPEGGKCRDLELSQKRERLLEMTVEKLQSQVESQSAHIVFLEKQLLDLKEQLAEYWNSEIQTSLIEKKDTPSKEHQSNETNRFLLKFFWHAQSQPRPKDPNVGKGTNIFTQTRRSNSFSQVQSFLSLETAGEAASNPRAQETKDDCILGFDEVGRANRLSESNSPNPRNPAHDSPHSTIEEMKENSYDHSHKIYTVPTISTVPTFNEPAPAETGRKFNGRTLPSTVSNFPSCASGLALLTGAFSVASSEDDDDQEEPRPPLCESSQSESIDRHEEMCTEQQESCEEPSIKRSRVHLSCASGLALLSGDLSIYSDIGDDDQDNDADDDNDNGPAKEDQQPAKMPRADPMNMFFPDGISIEEENDEMDIPEADPVPIRNRRSRRTETTPKTINKAKVLPSCASGLFLLSGNISLSSCEDD